MATKKFIIECEMEERWVDKFCSMLLLMQKFGDIGESSVIGFFSDGDGDFRPKFNIDTIFNISPGIFIGPDKTVKAEVLFDAD